MEEYSHLDKLKNHENFQLWKFQVTVMFRAIEALDVIDGTTKKPVKEDSTWIKKDAQCQKILITTIEKNLQVHLMTCSTSNEMWIKILEMFENKDEERKCLLMQEFFNIKMGKGEKVSLFLSKIKNLFSRLKTLDNSLNDDLLTNKIVSCLPDKYDSFVTAWRLTGNKNQGELVSNLIAEDIRHENKNNGGEEPVAFVSKERTCFNCKKPGHFIHECPTKKHQKKGGRKNLFCTICKKKNHVAERCFFRNKEEASTSGENSKKKDDKNKVCFLSNADNCTQDWVIDSGSSLHLTNQNQSFEDFEENIIDIGVAKKGEIIKTMGSGTIEMKNCFLKDVFYVPDLATNLLSVKAITDKGGEVLFTKNKVMICKDAIFSKNKESTLKNRGIIIEGKQNETGLFTVNFKPEITSGTSYVTKTDNLMTLHKKMGHLGEKNLRKLSKICDGLKLSDEELKKGLENCDICLRAKQTRLPFSENRYKANKPLEIIHSDVCGPIEPTTWDDKSYFVTFTDDHTNFTQTYLLSHKNEVFDALQEYSAQVEAKWNTKINKLRCDQGGEYSSKVLKDWCKKKGTLIDYTTPFTPQLNGKSERKNRTIMERARAMLYEAEVAKELWGEAVLVSTYLINRSPKNDMTVTPYEAWTSRKPNLDNIAIFGCVAFAKRNNYLKKLDERSKEFIFVGYNSHGYRLWDPEMRKIVTSRDVIFREPIRRGKIKWIDSELCDEKEEEANNGEDSDSAEKKSVDASTETEGSSDEDPIPRLPAVTRSGRKVKPTQFYGEPLPNDLAMMSYIDAISSPDKRHWMSAIEEEKQSLAENDTWDIVSEDEARGKKLLSNRWVFRIKDNGVYKARLVVRGCEQKENFDYNEIFSPVANASGIKFLMCLAVERDMVMAKFDVKTAFLHGNLEETIFMKIPEGYTNLGGKVCKLKKSLYGLKQAPLCWNVTLTDFLKELGLIKIKSDHCIFKSKSENLYLAIHVDDGFVIAKNEKEIEDFFKRLNSKFKMTTEINPKTYLGMEIERGAENLKLTQKQYIKNVLATFNMSEAKGVTTPMLPNQERDLDPATSSKFPYRQAVGALLYLSNKTRPDIAYAVSIASRNLENPKESDIDNVKRIFKYLRQNPDSGVMFKKTGEIKLDAYCDSSFADDRETRKSTTGFIILMSGGALTWSSRKQPIVTLSTTESEFVAAADCTKEVLYLKHLIEEIVSESKLRTVLHIDNQSAIKIIKNGVFNKRSKHIEVRYHFLHEKYCEKVIDVEYCPSEKQLADILTKPLCGQKFEKLKNSLTV